MVRVRPTVANDVLAEFTQGLANGVINVEIEDVVVLPAVPLGKERNLLRDGGKQTDDDTHGNLLHRVAELSDQDRVIGRTVMNVELHLFPDTEQDQCKHEDGRPMFELLASVHALVERRQFVQNVFVESSPQARHGLLDGVVDDEWRGNLSVILGIPLVDSAGNLHVKVFRVDQCDLQGEVVCDDELESFANDG